MNFQNASKAVGARVAEWRALTLAPLDVPLFKMLWIAALFSNFGTVIQTVGASWMMTMLDPSELSVALVQTSALVPFILISLPAGALADNADRGLVMLSAQILGCASATLLTILAYFNAVTPLALLGATAVIGAAVALYQPAWQASLGDLVPRHSLPAAIGLNSLAFNIARTTGPALGGLLVASVGPIAAFALNAVSFVGLLTALSTRKLPQPARTTPPEPMREAMEAGLRYVVMAPALRATFVRGAHFGFGASAIWSMPPIIAQQRLEGGPVAYGMLLAGFGIGSLLGALMTTSLQARLGVRRQVQVATLMVAGGTLGLALSANTTVSIGFMIAGGFGWISAMTTFTSAIQLASPRWVVGRAVALGRMSSFGALALGSAISGALAQETNVTIACASAAAALALGLFLPGLELLADRSSPDLTTRDRHVPAPKALMELTTGPLTVLVEYKVPSPDTGAFLEMMFALGRIRRRDGARNWSIAQDIDEPTLWVERFDNPTWSDYVRRVARSTVADDSVHEVARRYQVGERARRLLKRPPGATALSETPISAEQSSPDQAL